MAEEIKVPYLLKGNYFTEGELAAIWRELDHLNRPGVFEMPDQTGGALDEEGAEKKANAGVWLHQVYKKPKYSAIFQAVGKLFEGYTVEYALMNYHNRGVIMTDSSNHLVSYYEDQDHYKPHRDRAVATALHWLWKEPKKFEGGVLTFTDSGEEIPLTNNTMILFPSYAVHEVSPVTMAPEDRGKGLGRYCISTFMFNAMDKE